MQTELDINSLAEKIIAKMPFKDAVPTKWLKLNQAVRHSNIGKDRLIQLAKEKKIDGFQDPDLLTRPWIFDIESLDQYRRSQLADNASDEADSFALDLMGKIGH